MSSLCAALEGRRELTASCRGKLEAQVASRARQGDSRPDPAWDCDLAEGAFVRPAYRHPGSR